MIKDPWMQQVVEDAEALGQMLEDRCETVVSERAQVHLRKAASLAADLAVQVRYADLAVQRRRWESGAADTQVARDEVREFFCRHAAEFLETLEQVRARAEDLDTVVGRGRD